MLLLFNNNTSGSTYTLAANAGSVVVSGTAATLARGTRTMVASPGSFAVPGVEAALHVSAAPEVETPQLGLRLTLGGVDFTSYIKQEEGAVSYDDEVNTRSTLSVTLIDDENVIRPEPGESVVLEDLMGIDRLVTAEGDPIVTVDGDPIVVLDSNPIFGGTIENVDTKMEGAITDPYRTVVLECVSFDQLADRHIVAEIYENVMAGDIVRDIVEELLGDDGVATDFVEDGELIQFVLFNYVTATDAFNKLSAMTGYLWYIDTERRMHFQQRSTANSPYVLTDQGGDSDVDSHQRSVSVKKSRQRYRNRQFIRAGRDLTEPRDESFVGDGERKTFNLAFPAGEEPDVSVNGIAQTVGIRGVETGFDWYWNKDTTEISQDEDAAPLEDDDQLVVTYRGLYPVVVIVNNETQIDDRRAVEGGSGLYENVADEPNIDSASVAVDTALAYLERDGILPTTIEIQTERAGYKAGQLLAVDLQREDVQGDFLIISVSGAHIQDEDDICLLFTVKATDSGYLGGWVEYFRKLAAAQRAQIAREDETLIDLRTVEDGVICGDEVAIALGAPEHRIGYMDIGTGEIGPNEEDSGSGGGGSPNLWTSVLLLLGQ